MIIIENIEYKNTGAIVTFSDGNNIKMHLDIVIKYSLQKGQQLTADEHQTILKENEQLQAVNLAVRYVQTALKTKEQVRKYLIKKGISAGSVEVALNKLLEYKYINDNEYAKIYVRNYQTKYGKFKLAQNLFQKGVEKEIIEEALLEIDNLHETIYNIATKYLNKKEKNLQALDKLYRFLMSRGYQYDEVAKVLDRLKKELAINAFEN